jgi:hypothetical protein
MVKEPLKGARMWKVEEKEGVKRYSPVRTRIMRVTLPG